MATNAERLESILKSDGKEFPRGAHHLPGELFSEVLDDIRKERTTKVKESAKALLIQALDLEEQGKKLDSEYKKSQQKREKDLGNILRRIESMLSGKVEHSEDNEDKTEKES